MTTDPTYSRQHAPPSPATQASFSIPSILAIICAIVALFFQTGFSFILAILAVVFGIVGAVMALSPSVRGGIISVLSVAVGLLAAIISIIGVIFRAAT